MRDIFEEIFIEPPADPMVSARQGSRVNARKRFYKAVSVGDDNGILLDGKPVRTPARGPLAAPNRRIADAIASEWNAQTEIIDPGAMPLTRLANAILDAVADNPQPVADEIAKFLESDMICYRAGEPEALVAYQTQQWDPVLAFARDKLGARFVLAQGVVFQAQPAEALAAARRAIPSEPWTLGALSSITTLTGSALIALALAQGALKLNEAWTAAHADEDFQMRQWGQDEQAMARRTFREKEMRAAALVLGRL